MTEKIDNDLVKIQKLTKGLIYGLAVQFILGMGLNILGEPDESTPIMLAILSHGILILHALTAIAVIFGAILLVHSIRSTAVKDRLAITGLVGISIAAVAGGLTTSGPGEEFWSFMMSLGFILALVVYALFLSKITAVISKI